MASRSAPRPRTVGSLMASRSAPRPRTVGSGVAGGTLPRGATPADVGGVSGAAGGWAKSLGLAIASTLAGVTAGIGAGLSSAGAGAEVASGAAATEAGTTAADTGAGAGAGAEAGAAGGAAEAGAGAAAGGGAGGVFSKFAGAITSPLDILMLIAWLFNPRMILRAVEFLVGLALMIFGFHAALQARGEKLAGFSSTESALSRSELGRVAEELNRSARSGGGRPQRPREAPHKTRGRALRQRYQRESDLQRRQAQNPRPKKSK